LAVKLRRVIPAADVTRSISACTSGSGAGLRSSPYLYQPLPVFWPKRPSSHKASGDERLACPRLAELIELLAHAPGDIDAGHVVDREDSHRHAEVGERAIDLLRRGAILHEELRLVHVGEHHAIAHKPGQLPTTTPTLPSRFATANAVAIDSDEVAAPRTISTRRITFAGLKKWRPSTVAGRFAAAAMSSMFSVEVFVARMQSGLAISFSARRPAS
jgi:hypothetical protein